MDIYEKRACVSLREKPEQQTVEQKLCPRIQLFLLNNLVFCGDLRPRNKRQSHDECEHDEKCLKAADEAY